ncbi:SDR family NAD(P)-dependent oxidoreductase [Geodermatophilus obscurus]|uniref:SDR family NAD(P)-dependent oxidoreductase n=1 Tax=Geodermatophilus obscurus TaxID=1861 RepID=UPI00059E18CE|nr:SDR family oxidoreductase [Geodermatophilus obscurus]
MVDLGGQVALVTGASAGIGRRLTEGLAVRGVTVAGVARGGERLTRAMAEVADVTGGRTLAVPADVTDRAAVEAAMARVQEECGPIDLLVNNAGLVDAAEVSLWEADPDQWWDVVESHVRGALLVSRAVVPTMVARSSGSIVNLASGSGLRARPEYSAYSVAKTGLMRITEALAGSLAGTGVRVFDLAPGVVETDMTRSMAMWRGKTDWTDPDLVVRWVVAIAEGQLDQWSGRFLHAAADNVDVLARVDGLNDDARRLRLCEWGPEDTFRR